MRAVNGETGLIMIELRRLPGSCRMTLLTIVAEIRRLMIRIVGRRKSGAVTRETVRCRVRVPAAVTVLTSQRCMGAGQGEACGTVIEVCRLPGIHVVTSRAIMIEISRRVVRLVCLGKC